MSKTHEHLEHAEHAEHAAHDPFDRRVAVTMAIIAAVLAGIGTQTHRTHNEVLRLVGEANRLRTEAASAEVEKSNTFARYQAKRIRQAQYEVAIDQAGMQSGGGSDGKAVAGWKKAVAEYKPELEELRVEGEKHAKRAEELMAQAKAMLAESEHTHHQTDRLDIAHLLAEVALVVCSLSLLTKRKTFWLGGILAAVLALAAAGSVYVMPHHGPDTSHADPGHVAPANSGHAAPAHPAPAEPHAARH